MTVLFRRFVMTHQGSRLGGAAVQGLVNVLEPEQSTKVSDKKTTGAVLKKKKKKFLKTHLGNFESNWKVYKFLKIFLLFE